MSKTKLTQRPRAKRITVPEEVKNKTIRLRVTQSEFEEIKQKAFKKKCTVSYLIMNSVLPNAL